MIVLKRTIGTCLSLFLLNSCVTVCNEYLLTQGNFQIQNITSDTSLSLNEVHVIGKVLDARTKVACSDGVVKNLVNDKKMVFIDSLGNFNLYLKSDSIKLNFSHSGNSDLETDTLFMTAGKMVKILVFLGSEIILD